MRWLYAKQRSNWINGASRKMFETCWIHNCYLEKKAVTRAAPTPTAANASHELPPFLASAVNSTPILSELNLSGTLACRRDGKIMTRM